MKLQPAVRRLIFACASALAPFAAIAAETSVLTPPLLIGGLQPVDAAFDIQFELYWIKHDEAAAFKRIAEEYLRNPRPHIKARYAEFLIEGKHWGAPDGQADVGWSLATKALEEGSVHAWRIVGWDRFEGRLGAKDPALGLELLIAAAQLGNSNAMLSLGDVYLQGRENVPVDLARAEEWFMRAANLGKPHSLTRLAKIYETELPDPNKAAMLYYEASTRGSGAAEKRLKELFDAQNPAGARAYRLDILWSAALGRQYQTRIIRDALQALEKDYPEDPLVLLALARVYRGSHVGFYDLKKAHAFFEKAIVLGSDDARADRAHLIAEGAGVKKDPARALAELRELADKGNARALAQIGYWYYWGTFAGGLLPKDAAKAFELSRRAADAGDYFGQANTGVCFEFGIGTKMDYALAAQYYRAASWRGHPRSREQLQKVLAFVK